VTHQTSWLESTGVCGVQQNQAGGSSVRKEPNVPLLAVRNLLEVKRLSMVALCLPNIFAVFVEFSFQTK